MGESSHQPSEGDRSPEVAGPSSSHGASATSSLIAGAPVRDTPALSRAVLTALQGTAGNASVCRMLARQSRDEDAPASGGTATASGLTPLHRRFLAGFGVDPATLDPAVVQRLGTALDMTQRASQALGSGAGSNYSGLDGAEVSATSTVTDTSASMSLGVVGPDAAVTIERLYHYSSGRLVLRFTYEDRDGNTIHATQERMGPNRILGLVPLRMPEGPAEELEQPQEPPPELDDFADLEAPEPAEATSEEGVGSFFAGAVAGDFAENDSYSAIAGQTVVGFIPIAGQVADVRDLSAAIRGVGQGRDGAWINVSIAVIGFVPGLDFLKGGTRVGKRALRKAAKESITEVAESGLKRARRLLSREAAQQAARRLRELAAGRIELMTRLRQMGDDVTLPIAVRDQMRKTANSIEDHLTPADLSGALRDRLGVPVRASGSGEAWDHLGEVETAVNSMRNARNRLIAHLRGLQPGTPAHTVASREADALAELMRRTQEFIDLR